MPRHPLHTFLQQLPHHQPVLLAEVDTPVIAVIFPLASLEAGRAVDILRLLYQGGVKALKPPEPGQLAKVLEVEDQEPAKIEFGNLQAQCPDLRERSTKDIETVQTDISIAVSRSSNCLNPTHSF